MLVLQDLWRSQHGLQLFEVDMRVIKDHVVAVALEPAFYSAGLLSSLLEDFFEAGELWLLQVQGVRHGRVHLVLEDGQDVTSAATTVVDLTFLALPGGTLDGYDMALVHGTCHKMSTYSCSCTGACRPASSGVFSGRTG